jgi:hypothetical protein
VAKHTKAHPGFKAVASRAESAYIHKGLSKAEAHKRAYGGIANRTRGASAAAKRANPHLKRVKG